MGWGIIFIYFKKLWCRAEQMAYWLGTLAVLPALTWMLTTVSNSSSWEFDSLTQTSMQTKHEFT